VNLLDRLHFELLSQKKMADKEKLVVIAYVPPFAAMWDLILIRIM
jgi:hypothetical protein